MYCVRNKIPNVEWNLGVLNCQKGREILYVWACLFLSLVAQNSLWSQELSCPHPLHTHQDSHRYFQAHSPHHSMACAKNCLHKSEVDLLLAVKVTNSPGGHEGSVGMCTAHQPSRFLKLVSPAVSLCKNDILWWVSSALILGGKKRETEPAGLWRP